MFFIYIFCLFSLALCQEAEKEEQYLELGQPVQGFVSPRTQNHHVYLFLVPQIQDQSDLIVQLKTLNPNSDPNLYISKNVKEPLSAQDADVQACEAKGMDVCVINNQKINEGDLLYISVVSRYPSRYSLRIELDKEQTLKIESFISFKMTNEKQSQIIEFIIPDFINEQTEIELNVQVVNQEQLEEPFQVYMNNDDNGPPSNDQFDYKAVDTWDNQKVIEFTQTKPFEKYKILIQGEQGAVFRVTATRSQRVKIIHQHETITQVVAKGEYDFYQVLFYKEYSCDIGIKLTPFKGYAKLYVHYNNQPPLLESYEWQEENKEGELIYISQKELKDKNIELNSLFITVMGEDLCTYQLQSTCESETYLLSGLIHQRNIKQFEIMKMQIYGETYENHQILLKLHTLQGIMNFLITNCTDESICPANKELFENQEKYEQMNDYVMIYSKQKQQAEYILNCQNWCTFYVLAMVDQNCKQDGRFTIQYRTVQKMIDLIQNKPHKSTVDKDQYQNYKFFISEDDQIQRLHFLVTPIQGDVKMYLSTTNQQPNEGNYEYKSDKNSINFGGRFGNQPQIGTYYLSIYGESRSKYMITVWAIKNFQDFNQIGKFPWHYIQLYHGDPNQHFLANDEFVLYKIDLVGYGQNWKETFSVILQKEYGQFQMFGFDHPETDENKALWQSRQIITIYTNDLKYPEILYLKIRLDVSESNFGSFRISYFNLYNVIDLVSEESFFNFITAGTSQSFRYEFKLNESFAISKRCFDFDQSSLILDFSFQNSLKVRFSQDNNTVVVEQDNSYQCVNQQNLCSEYFYFQLNSKFDQFYSVIISKIDKSNIQLKEDQPITKALPLGEDYFYLYCQDQEVNVLAYSYYGELTIYASVVQSLDFPQPSLNNHAKISKKKRANYQSSIYFSKEEIAQYNCVDRCIIKITIVVSTNANIDLASQIYDYTIQFNSKLIYLIQSEVHEGLSIPGGFKFYKINVGIQNVNLMIMLKPELNCNADLLVSKSKFPNLDQYDWGSFESTTNVLIIEPGNSIHPEILGEYYVGVHSYSECKFSIQYHIGKVEAYDIFTNQAYKFYVDADYTIYLKVFPSEYGQESMIFVQSHSETAYFFVDEQDQLQGKFNSYGQNVANFKYNNNGRGYLKRLTIESLKENSILIIALKTYTSEVVTIQVNSNQSEVFLEYQVQFQQYLEASKNVTFIINPQSLYTIVQMQMYSGQISCFYSFEKYYEQENSNYQSLELLNVQGENQENTFNITNIEDNYLKIRIESIQTSQFSIQYFTEKDQNYLINSIYPQFITIKSQSQKKFQFRNFDYFDERDYRKTFSIQVQILSDLNFLITNQKNRSLPVISVYDKDSIFVIPKKEITISNIVKNEYYSTEIEYQIVLENKAQFDQTFLLQVGTSTLQPLMANFKQLRTTKLHESTYWALRQINSYIFYEIQFCNGIFSAFVGKDYDWLRSGQYDQKIEIKQNNQIFGYIKKIENADMMFLKFDFEKKLYPSITEAEYTIRVYQVEDQSEIPYDKFYPGLLGLLNGTLTPLREGFPIFSVYFSPLQVSKQDGQENFEIKQIEYFLLVEEGKKDDDINYCTEPKNDALPTYQNLTDFESTISISVSLYSLSQDVQTDIVFTILATVEVKLMNNEQNIQLDYYYKPQRLTWNSIDMLLQKQKEINYTQIGFYILVFILIIVVILLIRMKRKQFISKYDNSEVPTQNNDGIELHYRGLNE